MDRESPDSYVEPTEQVGDGVVWAVPTSDVLPRQKLPTHLIPRTHMFSQQLATYASHMYALLAGHPGG